MVKAKYSHTRHEVWQWAKPYIMKRYKMDKQSLHEKKSPTTEIISAVGLKNVG